MPFSKDRLNFCKIATLIVEVVRRSLEALLLYFLHTKNIKFDILLNYNKHNLYHLYINRKCQTGKCDVSISTGRVLSENQLQLLYDTTVVDTPFKTFLHFTQCPAKSDINIQEMDITLLCVVLKNCCITEFWESCLQDGNNFDEYLNTNKHKLLHMWKFKQLCCKCNQKFNPVTEKSVLNTEQFKTLFSEQQLPSCSLGKECFHCSVTASSTLQYTDIDDTLAAIVISYICPLRVVVGRLIEYRNNVYAHISKTDLSDSDFQTIWDDITTDIMILSKHVGQEKKVCRYDTRNSTFNSW